LIGFRQLARDSVNWREPPARAGSNVAVKKLSSRRENARDL
jgi:hypothetical protein